MDGVARSWGQIFASSRFSYNHWEIKNVVLYILYNYNYCLSKVVKVYGKKII